MRGPYVEGLTVRPVPDFGAFRAVLEEGSRERTVAATACNTTSSRAHTIVQLTVTRSNPGPGGEIRERVSKIDLVDLAGSERVAATGARGRRLEEGASINKSLSALGNCIRALSDMQARAKKLSHSSSSSSSVLASSSAHDASGAAPAHIPFRDSVLTWLLKSSLGGNSKTALVAAVSPGEADHDETLSTLRFADRMQRVETVAVVNEGRRVVPPQASGGDDAQRASHTGSDRLVRGSATPPRTDAVGGPGGAGGPSPGGDGDPALAPGVDLTAAALRNYRHQRAAAHQRPPRRSRSRKTSNGSGELPTPASPQLAGAATMPARGAGSSTRVTWDSSRVVVSALPAALAPGGATMPARLGPAATKLAATRRSLSPQRSLSMPTQRTSPSPTKLRLGNGTAGAAGGLPAGSALQSSTSPLKQRLAARVPPPRRPAGGAPPPPPPPPLQQQHAHKQQGPLAPPPPHGSMPPSPPMMPPSPPQQVGHGAKQGQGRPTPLQMPSSVVPPSSLEAEPESVWHLPAYPPTPSHISLPDGDSPSQHAWAPLPPSDGELPRWDSPLTPPVRRKSSLAGGIGAVSVAMLSPAAVAAAASGIVAAVQQNQPHDGASAGKAHRLSMEYLEQLEHGIARDARRRSSGGGGLHGGLPPPGTMHVTY